MNESDRQTGLTRMELVVVSLVALMAAGIIVPYILQKRVVQRRLFCEMRQTHTGFALIQFESASGAFPGHVNLQAIAEDGQRQPASWVFPALPYLHPSGVQVTLDESTGKFRIQAPEQMNPTPYAETHDRYGPRGEQDDRGKSPEMLIKELVCPADRPPAATVHPSRMSFVANTGMPDAVATEEIPADWPANGVFTDQFSEIGKIAKSVSMRFLHNHDGASHTLMLSENVDAGAWTDVAESLVGFTWVVANNADPSDDLWPINRQTGNGDGTTRFARPSSYHPGGINAVFCNGRTTFLSEEMDYLVYVHLLSSDGTSVMTSGTTELLSPPHRVASEAE